AVNCTLAAREQRRRERLAPPEFGDLLGPRAAPMVLEREIDYYPRAHGDAEDQEQPLRIGQTQPRASATTRHPKSDQRASGTDPKDDNEQNAEMAYPGE